jgi:hypothetical protein
MRSVIAFELFLSKLPVGSSANKDFRVYLQ